MEAIGTLFIHSKMEKTPRDSVSQHMSHVLPWQIGKAEDLTQILLSQVLCLSS